MTGGTTPHVHRQPLSAAQAAQAPQSRWAQTLQVCGRAFLSVGPTARAPLLGHLLRGPWCRPGVGCAEAPRFASPRRQGCPASQDGSPSPQHLMPVDHSRCTRLWSRGQAGGRADPCWSGLLLRWWCGHNLPRRPARVRTPRGPLSKVAGSGLQLGGWGRELYLSRVRCAFGPSLVSALGRLLSYAGF